MKKRFLILLSLVPLLMLALGIYQSLNIPVINKSAAARYQKLITSSKDICQTDKLEPLLKRSSEIDIFGEEAFLQLSAVLEHLSFLIIILCVLQLCILFLIAVRTKRG